MNNTNVQELEKAYYEAVEKMENHWKLYDEEENLTDEKMDELDEIAEDYHVTIENVTKEVTKRVQPMMLNQSKETTEEEIRNMFILNREEALGKAFKLLRLMK